MAKRLWDKGGELDSAVQAFTVGNDPEIDLSLIRWDCFGSAAHARMLSSVGLLGAEDCKSILSELKKISKKAENGEFSIAVELEDGHTAIESALVEALGESGKRVHAGRSRNDQVITATRLYLRNQSLEMGELLLALFDSLHARFLEHGSVMMPGYTHLQRAMPSSIGMWLEAFAEHSLELTKRSLQLAASLDRNPLGAAAGFGASLPLDREFSARLMGFSSVQRNPIDVQNSRGRYELCFLNLLEEIAGLVEKLAWDMQLYVTDEFGFISLPLELTTGSSIMPQKRNPDILELLRGRAAKVRGARAELAWVVGKMPSNYHRDFQYTKEPVLKGAENVADSLRMLSQTVSMFTVNEEHLQSAMSDELFATYEAYRQVKDGKPFRDAYRETAKQVTDGTLKIESLLEDFSQIQKSVEAAMSAAVTEKESVAKTLSEERARLAKLEEAVYQG